jgi:hypothetical protein
MAAWSADRIAFTSCRSDVIALVSALGTPIFILLKYVSE